MKAKNMWLSSDDHDAHARGGRAFGTCSEGPEASSQQAPVEHPPHIPQATSGNDLVVALAASMGRRIHADPAICGTEGVCGVPFPGDIRQLKLAASRVIRAHNISGAPLGVSDLAPLEPPKTASPHTHVCVDAPHVAAPPCCRMLCRPRPTKRHTQRNPFCAMRQGASVSAASARRAPGLTLPQSRRLSSRSRTIATLRSDVGLGSKALSVLCRQQRSATREAISATALPDPASRMWRRRCSLERYNLEGVEPMSSEAVVRHGSHCVGCSRRPSVHAYGRVGGTVSNGLLRCLG